MPFGAFVRIAAGVEGLVHISELAHHRVTRVDSVIQEGQEINVKVLSVDEGAQKMSLSLKAALGPPPADEKDAEDATPDEAESTRQPVRRSNKPLKGGLNKPTGGEDIGLRW
jgi:small subunit ribosomal protein S1